MPLPHWILDEDGQPQQVQSMREWGKWMAEADHNDWRRVDETELGAMGRVSTVFLGQDHSFGSDDADPVLFESMVFGGPYDQVIQERYSTRHEAEVGHALLVSKLEKRRDELLEGLEWGDDPALKDKALETVLRLRKHRLDDVHCTAEEVAAAINAQAPGGVTARVDGGSIVLTADVVGTMGSVRIADAMQALPPLEDEDDGPDAA